MNSLYKRLETELTLGLRAWRRSRLQRGIAISLLGLLFLCGFILLAAPALVSFPALWWFLLGIAALGWTALTIHYLILPLRYRPTVTQIARYIEEQNPDLEDRLITAVEFGRPAAPPHPLLQRLLQDAITHTAKVDFAQQLQIRFARVWRALAAVSTVMALIAFFGYSGALRQKLHRLYTAVQHAPKILRGLEVSPGDARVRRGEAVEIVAQSPEVTITKAAIYVAADNALSSSPPAHRRRSPEESGWSPDDMEPTTQPGKFLYHLFEVRDTLRYYVRVGEEFSPIYTIIPLDAPEIEEIRLTYHFPVEIGLTSRKEIGTGDVYAPERTQVDLEIVVSQRLTRAEWQFGDDAAQPMQVVADTLARFSFTVEKNGYYVVRLTNTESLTNSSAEYFIHVLPDEAPQITILRPGRDLRPTMLEEVPIAASVREDYGLKQLYLIYSINDQPPVRQDLLAQTKRAQNGQSMTSEYRAETLLFLEDLAVQPGDFISYYFEVADARQQATTDLYFLEVRPFAEEFYKALSQGGGGESSLGLAVSQKEIITATWKLERQRSQVSEEELKKGSHALSETQESLRESVLRLARMQSNFPGEGGGKMIEYLEQAAEAMHEAVPLLRASKLAEALNPERRAYQLLLKADAEIRRRELAQNSGAASTFGQLQSSEELARLFQDELNKIQSKYETLQNQQQRQHEAQLDEALQKVRELARRQERLNELNRVMQRENSAKEEKKRQIERLHRQQEELNRDVRNLARQMQQLGQFSRGNQPSLQQLEESLQRTAEDMTRMTDNLRRDNLPNAGAEGNRALERLRRLEERLQQRRSESLREDLAQEEKLDLALQETQRLRRDLEENMRERSHATASQQQGGARSGQQNPNAPMTPEEMNRWSERAWQGIRDLEKIAPSLRNDTSLVDEYGRLLQTYRGLVRTFRGGDLLRRDEIEKQILDPLRRFEAELAARLAHLQHQQLMLTARDEPVPPQYREMVEKYFERLAKMKRSTDPDAAEQNK